MRKESQKKNNAENTSHHIFIGKGRGGNHEKETVFMTRSDGSDVYIYICT